MPSNTSLLTAVLLLISTPSWGQSVLPRPEHHFEGVVGTTFKDSEPATFPQPVKASKGAPNVLLVLLDDCGFGQFSVTGGGVPSPSMDKLWNQGVLYNRFHTTALCSPTRAALLTGRNHHVAGTGVITELATGYDGYTGIIPKSTATVGEILRQNGYITAWFGKNHNTPVYETSAIGPFDHWPNNLGFDYFYGFMAGDTSQFKPELFENLTPVERPDDPNYTLSADLCDKTIAWLQMTEAVQPTKPWFAYLATAATHSPHQAPPEWIARFKGKFDMGWDAYREQTFERQKKLGVIPAGTKLTPRPKSLPAWDSLNADQKRLYERMMECFAGYGAQADYEVGRVLDYVATLPDADNTMIIYIVGDNGSSAEGGLDGTINENALFNAYQFRYQDMLPLIDELGTAKHFNHFPAEWAWAMDAPFQWTKQVASHLGGVRNPMIITWPAKIKEHHAVRSQFTHVIDVAPTILDAAGIEQPSSVNGTTQTPIEGRSFLKSLTDKDAEETQTCQYFEMLCNRAIYKDGWWLASLAFEPWQPVRTGYDPLTTKWELYDLNTDFSQANNVAAQHPEKVKQLEVLWWAQAAVNKVLPLDWRGPERFSAELTGKPNLAGDRKTFVYPVDLVGLPEAASPDLKNKSFGITANVEVKDGASGMLFTQGGNTGGWAFYMQGGKLLVTHNYIDLKHYTVSSDRVIPAGKHELRMEFIYEGDKEMGKSGTATPLRGRQAGRFREDRPDHTLQVLPGRNAGHRQGYRYAGHLHVRAAFRL